MTVLEMQDAIKGIFHWLSMLQSEHSDCLTTAFAKEYLPYLYDINPICLYINLRAFLFRRIINSYRRRRGVLFHLYIHSIESDVIKISKKQIKRLIRKIRKNNN